MFSERCMAFQAVDRTSNSRVALKIIKNRSRVMEQAREEHHILKYLNARDPQQLTGVGRRYCLKKCCIVVLL